MSLLFLELLIFLLIGLTVDTTNKPSICFFTVCTTVYLHHSTEFEINFVGAVRLSNIRKRIELQPTKV